MSESENNLTKRCPSESRTVLHTPLQEGDETPEDAHIQSALLIKEERFRSLALATAQIVWITDSQGKALEAPDWLAFTGQSMEEVKAGNWLAYVHPEDQAQVASAWTQSVVSRTRFDSAYRIRKQDGSYEYFEVHGVPLFNPDSSIREWVGTSSNITTHKQSEATIELLRERLRRAFLEMDHRVKNNLQLVAALVETQAPANSEATLKRVIHYTHALASLHDLLAKAAKESGAETDALSMRAILAELTPLLQVRAGKRRIAYQAEEILSPVQQIASLAVLVNELVVNAIQHGKGDIELTFEANENRARLEVCDEGPGFPPDFEPHHAAKTGLELVQSTVRHDLQGEVHFMNQPDGGACVEVRFPLRQVAG